VVQTAALFLDFDNIYSSLNAASNRSAKAFAESPLSWLKWFEAGNHRDSEAEPIAQNIALRSCYLNPTMFGKYRKNFVFSGFKTIDCPALTGAGKNSADIHMVLDMIDALKHNTVFDEFIILSADADFTPVLLRLREWQRATSVISTAVTSDALRNAATNIIDIDRFISEALGTSKGTETNDVDMVTEYVSKFIESNGAQRTDELPGLVAKEFPSFRDSNWLDLGTRRAWIASMVAANPSLMTSEKTGHETLEHKGRVKSYGTSTKVDLKSRVISFIEQELQDEGEPIDGASIGHRVNKEFGPEVKNEGWFGSGRLSDFINSADASKLTFIDNKAMLKSAEPSFGEKAVEQVSPFSDCSQRVVDMVEKLHSVGWPRLSPKQIELILDSTLKLIKDNVVERNSLSGAIRDDIRNQIELGNIPSQFAIGRQSINYILTSLIHQGVNFREPNFDIDKLRTDLWNSMTHFHENMFGEPIAEEYDVIDELLGVQSEFVEGQQDTLGT
jgi:hypothetical protein